MDPDALRDEVDEWVREGIITEQQAEEILARYDEADAGRSRVVVALSLVGAALVFVGITLFLGTNWDEFPRAVRAAVLVAGPGLAYAGGVAAYRQNAPQIGLALCLLGATLAGPSLFLFDNLFALELDNVWLLLAWTAVALPTGHVLDSRVGTGFGLLLLVSLVVDLADTAEPVLLVGLLGVVLFVLGQTREGPVAWTYHVGGVAVTLSALVVLTTAEGRFGQFDPELTAALVAGIVGAIGGVAWLTARRRRVESGWATGVLGALAVGATVATLAPDVVPSLVAFVGTHLATLGALLATGYLGYRTRSQRLIDLAAVGGLFQTLSLVSATVIDELSGSVALVVAGLVLLGAGVALERGRRSLLQELEPQEG